MPWLKQGDAAANHPIVLRALELDDADDRTLNELFGFVARCATQSAAYEQDYIVTVGTAKLMAGSLTRYRALIAAAKSCGYLAEVTVEQDGEQRTAFRLVEDNDLFHMILKAERDWENQRKRDARDPELTARARLRDGDACRYCGKSVNWNDRRSGRGGTYDHVIPGKAATLETYVVCCKECNSRRKNDPDSEWRTRSAPRKPLYGPETVEFLATHGITVEPSYQRTLASTKAPATEGTGNPGDRPAVENPRHEPHGGGRSPAADTTTQTGAVDTSRDPGTPASDGRQVEPPALPAPLQPDRPDRQAVELPNGDVSAAGQDAYGNQREHRHKRPLSTGPAGGSGFPAGPEYPGPSRAGTGRDGIGLGGTGRDGPGRAGADAQVPAHPPPRRRRRSRRKPDPDQMTTAPGEPSWPAGTLHDPRPRRST